MDVPAACAPAIILGEPEADSNTDPEPVDTDDEAGDEDEDPGEGNMYDDDGAWTALPPC